MKSKLPQEAGPLWIAVPRRSPTFQEPCQVETFLGFGAIETGMPFSLKEIINK
jgi:hypothetical protein